QIATAMASPPTMPRTRWFKQTLRARFAPSRRTYRETNRFIPVSSHAVSAGAFRDAVAEILKIVTQLLEREVQRKQAANILRGQCPHHAFAPEFLDRGNELTEHSLHAIKRRRILALQQRHCTSAQETLAGLRDLLERLAQPDHD